MRRRRLWLTVAVLGGSALLLVTLVYAVRPVLPPFMLAVAIAYVMAPMVGSLERRGIKRLWAILAVYTAMAAVTTVGVLRVLPPALGDLQRLAAELPAYSAGARNYIDHWRDHYQNADLPDGLRRALDGFIAEAERRTSAQISGILAGAFHLLEGVFSVTLAPFLAFYLLKDLEEIKHRVMGTIPRAWRTDVICLLRSLDRVLAGFVRGELLLGLLVGTLFGIACQLLGLGYPIILGALAGIAELVPIVGPFLGAIPAVGVAALHSPVLALETALASTAIQQLEGAVLAPAIMGESVGLHPLAVMFAILAGGYLGGLWGMVLAVPLAGVIRVGWLFLCHKLTETAPAGPGPIV